MDVQIKLVEAIPLLASYLIISVIIIYLCQKFSFLNKLGAIAIAYVIGIIIGNIGIIPEGIDFTKFDIASGGMKELNTISDFQETISGVLVALGIPLLLFSLDMRKWMKYAKKSFSALFLGLVSIIIMVFAGYFIFRGSVDEIGNVGGMLTGVYTGGTPNMAALKMSLEVDQNTYITASTYDMFLCIPLFLLLITYGQKIFGLILPKFVKKDDQTDEKKVVKELVHKQSNLDSYIGFFNKKTFPSLIIAFFISAGILAFSYFISTLIPPNNLIPGDAILILMVTTLGIAASFIPRIAGIINSFQLGMFLIIVFSLAVASMADVTKLIDISMNLFLYVLLTVYGTLILHLFLSKIFKVDADTFIIVTTALTYSPPFVPAVAAALKNKEIIMTGMITGLIGYAIGNYFGFMIGTFLNHL